MEAVFGSIVFFVFLGIIFLFVFFRFIPIGLWIQAFASGVQLSFLNQESCEQAQGFLFGRPAHMRNVAAIIAKDLRNTLAGETLEPTEAAAAPMQRQA